MDILFPNGIIKGLISGKKNKAEKYNKGKIQRIVSNEKDIIQISLFTDKQVFHYNHDDNTINNELIELLSNVFNNLELYTEEYIYIAIE